MYQIPKYREGLQYSEEVKNAVRYGYLYRKESENNLHIHACIGNTPDILLWLANVIIGGFAWDVIKSASKKLYRKLKNHGSNLDKNTEQVLQDETHLYEFIIFIRKFYERHMSLNDEQLKYIKEEIEADYVGKKLGGIISKEKREATTQEIVEVYEEARKVADNMLGNSSRS